MHNERKTIVAFVESKLAIVSSNDVHHTRIWLAAGLAEPLMWQLLLVHSNYMTELMVVY